MQPWQPLHDALAADGWAVSPDFPASDDFGLAIIKLPRGRYRADEWLARSVARLAPGGRLCVEGDRRDGVDAVYRSLRPRMQDLGALSKAHGRIFWGVPDRGLAVDPPRPVAGDGLATAAGVFSSDGLDAGTEALIAALPVRPPAVCVDLGAGRGHLARALLDRETVRTVALVEADHAALTAARRNVDDPRATFHWADATQWKPADRPDLVVTNPPFHAGPHADPSLGQAFIASAAGILAAGGALWLVANRHLPYEKELGRCFREWQEVAGTARFKILQATGPRSASRKAKA